jgi:ketosteroid isomerase-like protein
MNPMFLSRHTLAMLALAAAFSLPASYPGALALSRPSAEALDAGKLVAQEEAFSRASRERGTRAAFLEYLAEDGVILRPGPVPGREYWETAKDERTVLQWYASRAVTATSGDLGYTVGPWTSSRRGARQRAFGHYVKIWRREPDGELRAVFDGNISHPQRSDDPKLVAGAIMHEPTGLVRRRLGVTDIERRFAQAAETSGYESAAALWAIDRSLRMRDGAEPALFTDAPAAEGAPVRVAVEGSDVSAAGDLAYTYGRVTGDTGPQSAFLHVWRVLDGEPYLAVDLLVPLPALSSSRTPAP